MNLDLIKAQVNLAVPVFIRDRPVSGNEPDAGRLFPKRIETSNGPTGSIWSIIPAVRCGPDVLTR